MRIVLDLQGAQGESRFRGIGRYTLSLAQAIVKQAGDHEVVLALSDLFPDSIEPIRGMFDGKLPQERIRVWQAAGPVRAKDPANQWRRAAATQLREAFIASLQPDVVHLSDAFGGYVDDVVSGTGEPSALYATTASIYDLIPLLSPQAYLLPDSRYRRHYMAALAELRRVDSLLAISESSAGEAREHVASTASAVVNVSAACDPIFRGVRISYDDEQAIRARHGLTRPFILHTGGGDARKNLDGLIRAFAALPEAVRRSYQIALVGRMLPPEEGLLRRTASAMGIGADAIRFAGYVDDVELVALYNLCSLFVMPSVHEGFGLPALEAMSCGAPVIGSNTTSLAEVIGRGDAMFDPLDIASITSKLAQGLTDEQFRADLVRHGTAQAAKFSWDRTAAVALESLERVVDARRRVSAKPLVVTALAEAALVRDLRDLPGKRRYRDLVDTARAIAINHNDGYSHRLLVDVSELAQRDSGSGIQRVVKNIVTHLPTHLTPGLEMVTVYATADRPGYRIARYADHGPLGATIEKTPSVIDLRPTDLFLGLDLQHDVVASQVEFYAELRRLGGRVIFVVYDLLPIAMPNRFPANAERLHARWLRIVTSMDGAVCISRSVAQELRSWMNSHPPVRHRPFAIRSFPLGADVDTANPSPQVLSGPALAATERMRARTTFLVVGTLEPRKGHAQILAAFDRLWSKGSDLDLVIVGRPGWHVEALVMSITGHPEYGRRLAWLPDASDGDLDALYRGSSCLIVASEGEGFGLPLIEGARRGLPIIARDLPIFREVAGDQAFFFRGLDPLSLADAIADWLVRWREGRHPQPQGMAVMSWEQSAARLVDALMVWPSPEGKVEPAFESGRRVHVDG